MQQQPALELSSDQVAALNHVDQWWQNSEAQTFTLAGYAGTGKTTVIAYIVNSWPYGKLLIAAPTGKAAQRLREKGVDACTIHQLAYRFAGHDADGNPEFDWHGMARDRLVIVDEASMVNSEIYGDLIDNGYRILFVGDHGQLAPVGGDPGIMRNPDFALSVIHRQDDAGLLSFAHDLREGRMPEAQGAAEVLHIKPWDESDVLQTLAQADTAICWKNDNRHWLNHEIMQRLGVIPGDLPYDHKSARAVLKHLESTGEWFKLLVLRNNYRMGVANGQVVEAKITKVTRVSSVFGKVRKNGREFDASLDKDTFRASARGMECPRDHIMGDFGYCLTAHKAQGSEWPWVAVYDDYTKRDERARWAYTAATRAKDRLTWCRR